MNYLDIYQNSLEQPELFCREQADRRGLLCTTLSAESLSLKNMLKQEVPSTVKLVPLISA